VDQQNLRLEWVDPTTLTPNPKNWRRHPEPQRAALSDVLGEVGWAGALLWNETTGRLVDGHLRLDVALREKREVVPVLVGAWAEADEAKILATLDPIAALATVDADALNSLMGEIQTGSAALLDMLSELAQHSPPTVFDPQSEWVGMPEYEQEDVFGAVRTIKVHFETEEAVAEFAKRIGQELTGDTRSIWFPKHEREKMRGYVAHES
jgi:hypothetical protein